MTYSEKIAERIRFKWFVGCSYEAPIAEIAAEIAPLHDAERDKRLKALAAMTFHNCWVHCRCGHSFPLAEYCPKCGQRTLP